MSCIGKEVTGSSARFPVVDVLDSKDIVTDTAVLYVSPRNSEYLFHFSIFLIFAEVDCYMELKKFVFDRLMDINSIFHY